MHSTADIQDQGDARNGINGHSQKHMNGFSGGNGTAHTNGTQNGINITPIPTNGSAPAVEIPLSDPTTTTTPTPNTIPNDDSPIAICGLALRLPSGLKTPQQFWSFLLSGGDARSAVPSSRYNVSAFHDPTKSKPGTVPTEYGYFLDDELGALDTSLFPMPRAEIERINPEQRLLLEVTRECLEDAGEVDWRGKPIGCYVGCFGEDWIEMAAKEGMQWGQYRLTGIGDFIMSNRISYEFNLQGPSVTIRTACSASLTALNEACLAISRGDCRSAVVGGTSLIMTPNMTTAMTEHGVLSADGNCKTFSADADGYARGEAIVAIYVKKLSDAIADGNSIRAVIRATAINSDGKTPGMSCPSTAAHETLMRRAYSLAGITDYSQTAFVECHGTGTPIGDPIETKAVARVFGGENKSILIGSVKPNVGHTEGASGLVSVIKCILALENRIIPPNIKMRSPNPAIPWDAGLSVPLKPTPWPRDRCERVSINSFGAGGANAHVILDSAASFNVKKPKREEFVSSEAQLILLSATSSKSLTKHVENYSAFVEQNPDLVEDIAFTLAMKREHLPQRAFMIASSEGVHFKSQSFAPSPAPSVVMVFTGQGAQWAQMGRDLLRCNPVFLSTIRSLDGYLRTAAKFTSEWDWTIEGELRKPAKRSRINTAELAQPLCTALQIALVDVFKALDIIPQAVIGHSSGEIGAAYAVGALTAEEAIYAAVYRGIVASSSPRKGAMAAIGLSWEETTEFLLKEDKVNIACENSPSSVTISGDADRVEAVVAAIRAARPNVLARLLKVDKAYHSYHMSELSEAYRKKIKNLVHGSKPTLPFFSTVTGTLLQASDGPLDPHYWSLNLESPVKFKSALTSLLSHPQIPSPLFLELGPHSALSGPLRQTASQTGKPYTYIPTLIREQPSHSSLLSCIGQLWSQHVAPLNLSSLFSGGAALSSCLPDLPRYPFTHSENFWFEPRLSREHRQRKFPHHDLLGVKVLESTSLEPAWRNILHLDNAGWIREHKVGEDIVFPMVGYLAMAGEAVRQVTGVEEGFRVRHFVIHLAMVVPSSGQQPLELITTLRRERLTDQLDSRWWEFTVASHNGSVWTKHCVGMVASETEPQGFGEQAPKLPRAVSRKYLIGLAGKGSVNLGPAFQHYDEVSVDTKSQRTVGTIYNGRHKDADKYFIHPCLIDGLLQLAIFNQTENRRRGFQKTLPVGIEDLRVSRCDLDFRFDISVTLEHGLVPVNKVQGVAEDGRIVLSWSGLKLASSGHGAEVSEGVDPHAAARPVWGPDFDQLSVESQIRELSVPNRDVSRLEEVSQLCLIYVHKKLQDIPTTATHLQWYKRWIDDHCNGISAPQEIAHSCDFTAGLQTVRSHIQDLNGTQLEPAAKALLAVCETIDLLIVDDQASWENVVDDEVAEQVHTLLKGWDLSLIQNIAHTRPRLRVLEVGGGWRLRPSSQILDLLRLPNGQVACYEYVFASENFIPDEVQVKHFPRMEYVTLDIQRDFLEQGFEDRQFDLILVDNVLASNTDSQQYLLNLKTVLHPKGCLIMQGFGFSSIWAKMILGTHPQWRHRLTQPQGDETSIQNLRAQLSASGLRDSSVHLNETKLTPGSLLAVARSLPPTISTKKISLLRRTDSPGQTALLEELARKGYEVSLCTLEDTISAGQDVLALLDEEGPYFDEMSAENFSELKDFVLRLKEGSGIMWITRPTQMTAPDPRYAPIVGFARVARTELLIDFATCEVGDLASESGDVVRVWESFLRRSEGNDDLNPEFEYVIQDGVVNISRYYPFELAGELLDETEYDRVVMDIETPGRLNTLKWVRDPKPIVLDPDEIEVELHAVGLNFRDLLVAMRILDSGPRIMGLEGSGIVRKVGANVHNLKVGDRVTGLGYHNMFASVSKTFGAGCVKIPDDLSFEDASVMLLAWVTVLHSFVTVANLKKGQSVLIHSACGGVGLAAIELATILEAEIYVTVGTEEKIRFLMEKYHIPRGRIFSSRDDSFETDVMRETSGKGVDVVLNSLSGELLHASWKCVAPFGKLVEIGKRDLIGFGKLDMERFLANRSYCCIDIGVTPEARPPAIAEHVMTFGKWINEGKIKPPPRITTFNASRLFEAFRYLQPGTHIGRVAVSLRESSRFGFGANITSPVKTPTFDPSASYLLVGGLGGIGRSVSRWMVEHGARCLIYLSRGAGSSREDQAFVEELCTLSCEVQLVRGSVTNYEDVSKAFQAADRPIRGILQMSMVLRDQGLPKMTAKEWSEATAPKVQGTWNLHNASVEFAPELDFFLMFSSLSSTVGQHGQANYAGGNTFMDAFARYRQQLNLPATSIGIGAVDGIGVVAENDDLRQKLSATGFVFVGEQELLDALGLAMERSFQEGEDANKSRCGCNGNFVLGLGTTLPLSSPMNHSLWKKDRRMAIYHNTSSSSSDTAPTGANLLSYIANARADPAILKGAEAPVFLANEIGKMLCGLLLKPAENVNISMSLSDLGLDSLVGVELRAWWKQVFEFDVSVLEMLGAGTLEALGKLAADGLTKQLLNK